MANKNYILLNYKNGYLYSFSAIIFVKMIIALAILFKHIKYLGLTSKCIIYLMITIDSGMIYIYLDKAASDEKDLKNPQNPMYFLGYAYSGFAVFIFNIVAIKVYFIKCILESNSP